LVFSLSPINTSCQSSWRPKRQRSLAIAGREQ
jgi:hypothetical protein